MSLRKLEQYLPKVASATLKEISTSLGSKKWKFANIHCRIPSGGGSE